MDCLQKLNAQVFFVWMGCETVYGKKRFCLLDVTLRVYCIFTNYVKN